jgi:hypothetical protein
VEKGREKKKGGAEVLHKRKTIKKNGRENDNSV